MTEKPSHDEESKEIISPGMAFQDAIFEQLTDNSYAVYDRKEGRVSIKAFMVHDDQMYSPLPRLPWATAASPDIPEDNSEEHLTHEQLVAMLQKRHFEGEYGDNERLFNEVRDFYVMHLDVSNELFYDVYTAWTLMTWRIEDFKVVPYLFFLGPLSSGKTRALECLHSLGYRGIMASSMSAATIFRALEAWHPTLLLDETEIYNRESMVEVLALLNSGYRRGQYAIRMEKVEDGNPILGFFDTFGPKGLAGTQELADTLQSRAFITRMTKNVRHVQLFINEDLAQELRNKLLMYRFGNLNMGLDYDVSLINDQFSNARVIELFVSLLQVAPTEEIRNRLIECMKELTQSRLDEEQASMEAQVFEAILRCKDQVEKGKLSVRTVTEAFNLGLPENEQVSARTIGRRVAALGFEKCRLSGSVRGFFWTKELVDRLNARYFPPSKLMTQTTQMTQTTLSMIKPCQTEKGSNVISVVNPNHNSDETSQKTMKNVISAVNVVSVVSLEAPSEERTCGKCASWHKTSCSYPEGDPTCVNPLNKYALDCHDFIPEEAKT